MFCIITTFEIMKKLLSLDVSQPLNALKVPISYNLWILLRKIVIYLVGRKFYLRGFFAVKVDGSDVIVGIPECFNIQTRHKFENFCIFSLNSTYSIQNEVRDKQIPIVTSLQPTSTAKTSTKIIFSSNKIYYNFSQGYPKITNM